MWTMGIVKLMPSFPWTGPERRPRAETNPSRPAKRFQCRESPVRPCNNRSHTRRLPSSTSTRRRPLIQSACASVFFLRTNSLSLSSLCRFRLSKFRKHGEKLQLDFSDTNRPRELQFRLSRKTSCDRVLERTYRAFSYSLVSVLAG